MCISIIDSSRGFDPRSVLYFVWCAVFLAYFLFGAVWFHNRVPLGSIYIPGTWHAFKHTEHCCRCCCYCCCCCCCCSMCRYTAVLAASAAAVCAAAVRHRHRVPDVKFLGGSLNRIPIFSFSSFKYDVFLMYPLTVRSHLIYGLDLPTLLHPR